MALSKCVNKGCRTGFPLTAQQEAKDGRVKFPEEDPKILSRVFFFLYSGDYDYAEAESVPECFHKLLQYQPIEKPTPDDEKWSGYVVESFKTIALVYKCADMLGIEGLKNLAAKRFLLQAPTGICIDGFEEALRVMYESTASNDQMLRIPATRVCIQKYSLVANREETIKVILKHEPVVWDVATSLLEEFAAEKASLYAKYTKEKAKLEFQPKFFRDELEKVVDQMSDRDKAAAKRRIARHQAYAQALHR